MEKPQYHFFVCASFRAGKDPQGVCHRKGAVDLMQHLETEIGDRGLDAMVSSSGCLKACEKGPAMVLYSQGAWYGELTTNKLDEILDALESGEILEE